MKVMSVFGTRPEAIKMCPLVKELEANSNIESIVCLTGQHREMLQQVIDIFDTKVDYNLDIMRPRQTLTTITADVLMKLEEVLKKVQPDIVLVHGDTTTSFVAALSRRISWTAEFIRLFMSFWLRSLLNAGWILLSWLALITRALAIKSFSSYFV